MDVPLDEWSPRQKALARRHVAMAVPRHVVHVVTVQVCARLPACFPVQPGQRLAAWPGMSWLCSSMNRVAQFHARVTMPQQLLLAFPRCQLTPPLLNRRVVSLRSGVRTNPRWAKRPVDH